MKAKIGEALEMLDNQIILSVERVEAKPNELILEVKRNVYNPNRKDVDNE